jgi:hypothetical protein
MRRHHTKRMPSACAQEVVRGGRGGEGKWTFTARAFGIPAKRCLRHEVIGRKVWLFPGSDEGAESAVTIFSLVLTCKLCGAGPWVELKETLTRVSYHSSCKSLPNLPPKLFKSDQNQSDRLIRMESVSKRGLRNGYLHRNLARAWNGAAQFFYGLFHLLCLGAPRRQMDSAHW